MVDWSKYIPASGEASAQIGLKGRFGGSRMRGRSRFRRRSRYSYTDRNERYWVHSTDNEQGWEPWQTGPAFQFNITSQGIASSISASETAPFNETRMVRLLRTQGFILTRLAFGSGKDQSIPTTFNEFAATPSVIGWYAWMIRQTEGDGTMGSASAFSFAPTAQSGSDLRQLLRRKDVLQYGFVHFAPDVPYRVGAVDFTGPSIVLDNVANIKAGGLPFGRIPLPRIPKRGIMLGRQRVLSLIGGVIGRDLSSGPSVSLQGYWTPEYYTGHLRWLVGAA